MAKYKYLCFTTKPYNFGERMAQIEVTGARKKEVDQMIKDMRKEFPESEFVCSIEGYSKEKPTFNRKLVKAAG